MFKALEAIGTMFLRGQLVLVSAGPGTGKSVFALTVALLAKVPTLYFSADSDAFTQLTRSISIVTGRPLKESVRAVLDENISDVETKLDHFIRFSFDARPSAESMENSVEAYEEVYGEYPALVIVDNVTNVQLDGEDDASGLEGLMDYLHSMGRETDACVFCLHHVNGTYNDAARPIPLSGVKQQITRVPGMVLTLHKRHGDDIGPDTLIVSTVKNRGGKADPSGHLMADLDFEGSQAKISDPSSPLPGLQWERD